MPCYLSMAGFLHANNGGLTPAASAFWPVIPNVTDANQAIMLPWFVLCSSVGIVSMAAFFLSAGKPATTAPSNSISFRTNSRRDPLSLARGGPAAPLTREHVPTVRRPRSPLLLQPHLATGFR
jgi:hypothetical protein